MLVFVCVGDKPSELPDADLHLNSSLTIYKIGLDLD